MVRDVGFKDFLSVVAGTQTHLYPLTAVLRFVIELPTEEDASSEVV